MASGMSGDDLRDFRLLLEKLDAAGFVGGKIPTEDGGTRDETLKDLFPHHFDVPVAPPAQVVPAQSVDVKALADQIRAELLAELRQAPPPAVKPPVSGEPTAPATTALSFLGNRQGPPQA